MANRSTDDVAGAGPDDPRSGRSAAAVLTIIRADLRVRWPWVVLLAVLAAVVVTIVAAGFAGAQRTATVLDRFTDESATADVDVEALAPEVATDPDAGVELSEAIAEVPGVEATGVVAGFPLAVSDDDYFMVWSSADGSAHETIERPIVLSGRLPAADAPDEIAINEGAVEALDLAIGDVVEGPTLTTAGAEAAFTGEDFEGFVGPTLQLRVVGVVRRGVDLSERTQVTGTDALASPAFARTYGATIGSYVTRVYAQAPDPDTALLRELTAVAREEIGPFELRVETVDTMWRQGIAETYRTLAGLVAVFTGLLGIAALLVVVQALNRERFQAGRNDAVLLGLGLTRRARTIVAIGPASLALVAGGILGIVGTIAVSGRFPVGTARSAEVDPGVHVDLLSTVGVSAAVVAVMAGWVAITAWRATRRTDGDARSRHSAIVDRLVRAGVRPPTAVGVRMALEPGSGRVSLPVRSVVVGTAVAVAAVCGVLVVATSADDMASAPARYGWVWSTLPDNLSEDPEAAATQAAELDGIGGVAGLSFSTVVADGATHAAAALEVVAGTVDPTIFAGRGPQTDREVALAPSLADDLGLDIGDTMEVDGAQGGPPAPFTVVGTVVPPPVDDVPRVVVMTTEGLAATAQSEPAVYVALRYEPDADVASLEEDLGELGFVFTPSSGPSPPGRVEQFRTVRPLLVGLVGLLALLGSVGLVHFLALSVRRRGHDLAVLKALGFVRRDVRRVIVSQAVATTALGVIVGVPAGFVLGRVLWLTTVRTLDLLDDPASPIAAAVAIAVLVVLGAALLGIAPGAIAARRRTTAVLRAE